MLLRSTLNHLVTIEAEILNAFISNEEVIGILFDIEKAYDTISKFVIINNLYACGFVGNLTSFIKNFITNRKMRVRVGNTESSVQDVTNGIPLGSVLSCTLFAVGINSIVECIPVIKQKHCLLTI